ncbi:hypothetical protein H0A36_07060 [Endozoicomonas sp. SM1973]|uniref:L-tyrosine decarboxylase C-terminal domain-containing protein n=1 Tax=Spartinivicinus marinus TaxID=2994442 RepID=A0A853I4Z0_9GAMM|nr:pyridoxal-dependent decarboxylase [Spartinivicinus marinus]MCX4025775.1 pyridoxal-dependent decarboxylase [Spartinivicinus marinus]NYZ65768.1 hypothetical protein [Spartinivicinus marinus]
MHKLTKTINFRDIQKHDEKLVVGSAKVPDISKGIPGEPAAWFLGPQAENNDLLKELIEKSQESVANYRRLYSEIHGDPSVITKAIKDSELYKTSVEELKSAHQELLDYLSSHSTPFASLRYQGHMLWENPLPALAGYYATMLHNPNNVTIQASTATTPLAIVLSMDMCKMIGYPVQCKNEAWSHITADGSIANIEATWATREVKYMPFSLAMLLDDAEPGTPLWQARDMAFTTLNGDSQVLRKASSWTLFNIPMDEVLALPEKIADLANIEDIFTVWNQLLPYTYNAIGGAVMWQKITKRDDVLAVPTNRRASQPPIMLAPSTRHYSWPKAAAVCDFGMKGLWSVMVDEYARQPVTILQEKITHCLEKRIPVAMVVAVIGTTEESSVDPLADMIDMRNEMRLQGIDFNIHADAAWGGYMIAAIRKDYGFEDKGINTNSIFLEDELFVKNTKNIPLSDYVIKHYKALRHSDSVTIDPHKMGYIQYPAGSILYRNGEIRRLTTFTGSYIGGSGSVATDQYTIGCFGLEGSKPGAAPAAVYLTHRVIRPTVKGYGKIINKSMINAKRFYMKLMALNKDNDMYECVPLQKMPCEHKGEQRQADYRRIIQQYGEIKEHNLQQCNTGNWREFGPDLNIVDYVFNPKRANGCENTDVAAFRSFNQYFYDKFRVQYEDEQTIENFPPLMVSMTTFNLEEYGEEFIGTFAERIGLVYKYMPQDLPCIRSTLMDPYVTETAEGDFLDTLIEVIDTEVKHMVQLWRDGILFESLE